MRTPQLWNTPLKSLLRDLQSEDRKTENAALKELRRRFVGLDKEDQMQVLMHHLRREKSFREWAYSRLLDLWDVSFEPIIKGLWEQYHEEKCAWAVIRHFPLSYVLEHKEDLAIGDHTLLIEINLRLTNISGSSQQQGETLRQKGHGASSLKQPKKSVRQKMLTITDKEIPSP